MAKGKNSGVKTVERLIALEGKLDSLLKEKSVGKNAKRNKRRRLRRRNGQVGGQLPLVPAINTQSSGIVAEETANPFEGRSRGKINIEGLGLSSLPVGCREFVHRHCNPCGEMVTFTENSKVPDGALPNSTIIELREALIVKVPSSTGVLPLDGSMWTLTVIHLPLFRNPVILVASLVNAEMSVDDRAALMRDWNTSVSPPLYPEWRPIVVDNLYYSVVQWTGLNQVEQPTPNGTTAVQQFRITCDGMTMFNNTPDLINQGMVVGAQWPANKSIKNEEANDDVAGYTGVIRVSAFGVPAPVSRAALQVPVPIDKETFAQGVTVGVPSISFSYGGASYPWEFPVYIADSAGTSNSMVFTAEAGHNMIINTIAIAKGDLLNFSVARNVSNQWSWSVMTSVGALVVFSATNVASPAGIYSVVITDPLEMPAITVLQLPPTDTQNIIQSTPKAVYMSAKEQNGIYMVKRIFQPIFNVQEASERRQIVLTDAEVERQFTLSPSDVLDLNYGVGVTVWSSIPTSCAPAIKLIRDVEIVAGENSAYMPFMKSNVDKCEAALAICHSMAVHHPFMYPESYNILGGLMGIIGNVVSKIPILGNVVQAIPGIIKTITGAEHKGIQGASQNRLVSTNTDELMKVAQMLMRQLTLNQPVA